MLVVVGSQPPATARSWTLRAEPARCGGTAPCCSGSHSNMCHPSRGQSLQGARLVAIHQCNRRACWLLLFGSQSPATAQSWTLRTEPARCAPVDTPPMLPHLVADCVLIAWVTAASHILDLVSSSRALRTAAAALHACGVPGYSLAPLLNFGGLRFPLLLTL